MAKKAAAAAGKKNFTWNKFVRNRADTEALSAAGIDRLMTQHPPPYDGVTLQQIEEVARKLLRVYEPPPLKSSKIAIVGFATESMGDAPWDDPETEVWILNMLHMHVPRWDRLWEMHDKVTIEVETADLTLNTDHLGILQKEASRPIYMVDRRDDIPCSVRFPIERVTALQRVCDKLTSTPYYTSTFGYMLGWAILCILDRRKDERVPEPDEHIWVAGIELLNHEEYCVAPETKVLTADLRWVQAADVSEGDELMGFDETPMRGKGGGRSWRKATALAARTLRRPCYRLQMGDGSTLVSSAEHRWLTRGMNGVQWRRTDQLVTPHHRRPSRIVKVIEPWGQPVHAWDAGYLAAAFDGEGSLPLIGSRGPADTLKRMGLLGYAQRDNAMSDTVKQALEKYGFSWNVGKSDVPGVCRGYTISGGRLETLRFLGQMRPRRLLQLFNADVIGRMHVGTHVARGSSHSRLARSAPAAVPVVSATYIGEQEVVGLHTSTGTFVAEGFASHNSYQRSNAEFMIGMALGHGIPVHVPQRSALLESDGLYGYARAESLELLGRLRLYYNDMKRQSIAKRDEAAKAREQAKADWNTHDGAVQALDRIVFHLSYVSRGGKVGLLLCLVLTLWS